MVEVEQIVVPELRVVDPHWFNAYLRIQHFFLIADPDPVSNPGFWWPKIGKKITAEKKLDIFW